MKKKTIGDISRLAVWIILLVSALAMGQTGGPYQVTWSTIDGGGVSSGGQYELLSTIGQPDAAWSSGGNYELLGGFLPGGPLCFVDFEHFARFAEYWLYETCDEDNNFCDGADLFEDEHNIVDGLDLQAFVEQWLCYCPADWPLK